LAVAEPLLGLEDKVVVITGASQGVGQGCAAEFARAGAHVAIVARGLERAERVAASVRAMGREAIAIEADATREDDLDRVAQTAVAHFGRLDVAVNNVGGRRGEPEGNILESGIDYWQQTLELNLISVLAGSRAFARCMIATADTGVIVNVGSVSGFKASPGLAPYGAAKAGLVQLTKTLALELAPHGIRVNTVAPGMVDTDSLREYLSEEALVERGKTVPLGRIAQPEDIGRVAVLLASDLAAWVTGSTLVADGGELLTAGG
jgi:NAD(P)-dependent dehydrogenase (short-subunit alcohol dehydrogenase family)